MEEKLGCKLVMLGKNEEARIVDIVSDDVNKVRKLTSLGIMPGNKVVVIQKYPAIVIEVGFAQIALDNDIAASIIVKRD